MDIVSKNGALMLALGPRADGTIPGEHRERLLEIGKWLKVCGEAVYAAGPYTVYGEGPTTPEQRMQGDEFVHTAEDIRFTRNKANTVLCATVLEWPGDQLTIRSFRRGEFDDGTLKSVRLVGVSGELTWEQEEAGLKVKLPAKPPCGSAYPVRMEFEGAIPAIPVKQ